MRFFIPLLLLLLSFGCTQPDISMKFRKDVDSLIHKWVPDSREGICTLNLSILSDGKILVKGETNIQEARNEIIDYVNNSGNRFYDSLQVIPDTTKTHKVWGLVSVSVCNLKKSPSHSSELLSQAVLGTPLKILKQKGGWLLVQTPDYYIGWVNNSGIGELNTSEMNKWKRSDRIIYLKNTGFIYSEVNENEVVSDVVLGSIIEKTKDDRRYIHVVLPDGRKGMINRSDVIELSSWINETKVEPANLIRLSKSFLGTPYLWGGTSSKAFDCSGFVKTIYFMNGIILARDASLQFLHGSEVDMSNMFESVTSGDLVFFGTINNGKKRISHVGMYIGNTEVIHCSGMVRINSLDSSRENYSEYLKNGLMGARRIIGEESKKGIERIAGQRWYF
jgi:gamma-D-glutamyl-L-lysine dipeptidyl-peptidase